MAHTEHLTQREAAERLEISATTLRRLTATGCVRRDEDGTYSWPATERAYARYRKRKADGSRRARKLHGTDERLTQKDAASRIGITARQLRELTRRKKVPRNADDTYPWPAVADAYQKWRAETEQRREGPPDFKAEQARLARARADAQEMQNAVQRGQLVAAADVERLLREPLERVNVIVRSLPSRYAPVLAKSAGISVAKARRILGEVSESIRSEIRNAVA